MTHLPPTSARSARPVPPGRPVPPERPATTGRPGPLTAWARRRPLTSFFALTFGLSWIAWIPYLLSGNGLGVLPFTFPGGNASQLLGVLPGAYLGPVTAALVVTALVEGRAGLRAWRGRLLRFKVSWRWYLGVFAVVPTSLVAATFVLPDAWDAARPISLLILVGYLPMLLVQFITTALAEEPGWRDFALPRLQDRFGPVLGTVVLGLAWGAWHWPLFFTQWGGYPDITLVQPLLFTLSCVPLSLVMTWVFNRTGQSVPLVMLLHSGINSTYSLLWPAIFPTLNGSHDVMVVQLFVTTLATVVLVVATRGRLGHPRPHTAAAIRHEVLAGTPDRARPSYRSVAPYNHEHTHDDKQQETP